MGLSFDLIEVRLPISTQGFRFIFGLYWNLAAILFVGALGMDQPSFEHTAPSNTGSDVRAGPKRFFALQYSSIANCAVFRAELP